MKKLVLFDIDGTLVYGSKAPRNALNKAFQQTFDFDIQFDKIEFSGKTDPQIVMEILNQYNLDTDYIRSKVNTVLEKYVMQLEIELANNFDMKLCYGVRDLLTELSNMDVILGLLTGNVERGAKIKLQSFDLYNLFKIGAFGSDSMVRAELVDIALERTFKKYGKMFYEKDIVIIGDSIHDIECGRAKNVKSIAVATGKTPFEVLKSHNPDYIFDNFGDKNKVINAIMEG